MKTAGFVLLSLFICSNVMVHHCPRPLAPASVELHFQTDSESAQRTSKIYNLHFVEVVGDVLRPPHGTTPAAVKIKYVMNEDLLEARITSKKQNSRLGFTE